MSSKQSSSIKLFMIQDVKVIESISNWIIIRETPNGYFITTLDKSTSQDEVFRLAQEEANK